MRDGLYRVVTSYLCAGFVIENGKVTDCAPILRKRLAYWKSVATRIGPDPRRGQVMGKPPKHPGFKSTYMMQKERMPNLENEGKPWKDSDLMRVWRLFTFQERGIREIGKFMGRSDKAVTTVVYKMVSKLDKSAKKFKPVMKYQERAGRPWTTREKVYLCGGKIVPGPRRPIAGMVKHKWELRDMAMALGRRAAEVQEMIDLLTTGTPPPFSELWG